jgi:hypothetical protein
MIFFIFVFPFFVVNLLSSHSVESTFVVPRSVNHGPGHPSESSALLKDADILPYPFEVRKGVLKKKLIFFMRRFYDEEDKTTIGQDTSKHCPIVLSSYSSSNRPLDTRSRGAEDDASAFETQVSPFECMRPHDGDDKDFEKFFIFF